MDTAQASDSIIALGASFDKNINDDLSINKVMHEDNYALLPEELQQHIDPPSDEWTGRMSYRLASPDRQPVAGLLGDGMAIVTALGARGMVTGPIWENM